MEDHRYLALTDGRLSPRTSKTANSAIRYLPERVVGILDGEYAGKSVEEVLGFGGPIPIVGSLAEGLELNPTALLIGIAPSGGRLPEEWRPVLLEALRAGLDLVSGLHFYLSDDPELAAQARESGVEIYDLRRPPKQLPVSTGRARLVEPLVVHTVGTDSNIGKMTALLEIRDGLIEAGAEVGFAATGQTGILIEGKGIAVDAVAADFIAGAAEQLVLEAAEGNEIVLVEGQGSLIHPGYSGVTLGLLYGSLPDVMIICHQPTRRSPHSNDGVYDWVTLPSIGEMIAHSEAVIRPVKESKVIGVALNTSDLSEEEARGVIAEIEAETSLPTTDPVRFGPGPLVEAIEMAKRAKLGASCKKLSVEAEKVMV